MRKLLIVLMLCVFPFNASAQIIYMSDSNQPSNEETSTQDLKALFNIKSLKCDWHTGGQSFWNELKHEPLAPPQTIDNMERGSVYFDAIDLESGEAIMRNSIGIKKMVTVEKLAKGILFTQKNTKGLYDFVFIFSHRKGAMSLTEPFARKAFAFTAIYLGAKTHGFGDFISFENQGNCYSIHRKADANK